MLLTFPLHTLDTVKEANNISLSDVIIVLGQHGNKYLIKVLSKVLLRTIKYRVNTVSIVSWATSHCCVLNEYKTFTCNWIHFYCNIPRGGRSIQIYYLSKSSIQFRSIRDSTNIQVYLKHKNLKYLWTIIPFLEWYFIIIINLFMFALFKCFKW